MPDILESGNVRLSFYNKELMEREERRNDDKPKMYERQDVELVVIRLPNSRKLTSIVIFKLNIRYHLMFSFSSLLPCFSDNFS